MRPLKPKLGSGFFWSNLRKNPAGTWQQWYRYSPATSYSSQGVSILSLSLPVQCRLLTIILLQYLQSLVHKGGNVYLNTVRQVRYKLTVLTFINILVFRYKKLYRHLFLPCYIFFSLIFIPQMGSIFLHCLWRMAKLQTRVSVILLTHIYGILLYIHIRYLFPVDKNVLVISS